MKNLILFCVLLSLVFSGCKKESSNSPATIAGEMTYGNIKNQTPYGMLVYSDLINSTTCDYNLNIYSSGFTFDSKTGEETGVTGIGKIVMFNIVSPIKLTDVNADGLLDYRDIQLANLVLENGQYSSSSSTISKTFEGSFTIDATMTGTATVHYFESGTLNISKSGEIYSITYNGLDETNTIISGNFTGKLNVIRNP